MPQNLEIKARIISVGVAEKIAQSIQAQFICRMKQIDTYFKVANGRMKLREIDDVKGELIFYNREEKSDQRLSLFEVYPVADSLTLRRLLASSLGIIVQVRKTRTLYMYRDTRIHLDEVESLGVFLEFEVPIGETEETAKDTMNYLIRQFGINQADFIRESYSDMLISR